jgi:integrase
VKNHLIPAFGKKRLDLISEDEIDTWLNSYEDRGIKRNTANGVFRILQVMTGYAVTTKFIKFNPCANVEALKIVDAKKIEILTLAEAHRLFPSDWIAVWDNRTHYILNKLTCCTGMRIGEILGLRGEFVYDNSINGCKQFNQFGYKDTKNHRERTIPLPDRMVAELEWLKQQNGQGFLFSTTGGAKPISRAEVSGNFYRALERAGIGEAERKRRGITMHGWRHFFNIFLVMANVSGKKIRQVTGHSSDGMTRRYTHLDTAEQ